jgi:putative endonuclease
MEYAVYIVRCADGSLYTGITTDVVRRIAEHNGERAHGAKATRTRRPVTLVYEEKYSTRSEASKREYEIKSLTRTKKLKLISSLTTV